MKYYLKKNSLSIAISIILVLASFMFCIILNNDGFSSDLKIEKYNINLRINSDGSGSFDNYLTYDFSDTDLSEPYTVIYEDIVDKKGNSFSYGDINGNEKIVKENKSEDIANFDLNSFETKVYQNNEELNMTQIGYSFNNDIEMDTGDRVDSPYRNGERIFCYYRHGYTKDTTFNFKYKINGMVSSYLDIGIVNWILSPSTDINIKDLDVNITFEELLSDSEVNHLKENVFLHGYISYFDLKIDNNGIRFHVNEQKTSQMVEVRFGFNSSLVSEIDDKNKYDFEGQNLLNEVEELTRVSYDEYYNRFTLIKIISPLIILFLTLIVAIAWYIAYKKYDKERVSTFESEYYRELTGDYPPAIMGYLYNFQDTSKDDLSATIMDLIRRNYIKLDMNGCSTLDKKPNYIYILNREKNFNELKPYERFVIRWYFDNISKSDYLSLNEIDEYLKKEENARQYLQDNKTFIKLVRQEARPYKFFDEFKNLGNKFILVYIPLVVFMIISLIFQIQNWYNYSLVYSALSLGLIILFASYLGTIKRRTEKGNEDYVRWNAFKNFLLDFGKFDDYTMPLISIWEHYMVYAVSFGIADKVEDQMRLHFKSMGEDKGYDDYYSSSPVFYSRCHVYISRSCRTSTQVASNTIAQAQSSRGGSGGSFGGGRSFGGGGGGHGGR